MPLPQSIPKRRTCSSRDKIVVSSLILPTLPTRSAVDSNEVNAGTTALLQLVSLSLSDLPRALFGALHPSCRLRSLRATGTGGIQCHQRSFVLPG